MSTLNRWRFNTLNKIHEQKETIKKIRDGYIQESPTGKKVKKKGKNFKWLYYYPIDADPKQEWIEKTVALCDVAVPYTNYAMECSKKFCDREYNVIYHGFDKKSFFEISDEEKQKFRDEFFSKNSLEDKFLIVNVNRNQERKGLAQTLIAFKMLNKIFPNTVLYTHCDVRNDRGGNLIDLARQIGLNNNWLYPNPEVFETGTDFPISYMNNIYNIADVNISTTYGEGFGLSLIEAMATKTLNIFPNNTAIKELLADGRGKLVDCGNSPNNLIFNGHVDNNLIRPVTDVEDLINKLIWAYKNKDECKKIEEKAYKWATENMNWDDIAEEFDKLLS